ncbi:MAG: helix-turn-helix domain-containing protein [Lachnospiraceae bacterium]|nr:helix-turn-helix domain-containing protein [Lachnospiraceae bacterium]
MSKHGGTGHKLKAKEKHAIIEELFNQGVFAMKGAAPLVAATMGISVPSVYRYISKIIDDD